MSVVEQLIIESGHQFDSPRTGRTVAVCGGKEKSALIKRMAEELTRKNKKVLIAATHPKMPPLKGDLVVGRNMQILNDQLVKQFEQKTVIYIAKELKDNRLSGFKLSELAHLRTNLTVDYFFIELGVEGKLSDYAVKDLKKSIKCAFWEQLIYYFELTDSQDSIYNQLLYQLPAFNPKNYKTSSQKSDLIVAHLTDEDRGLRFLFEREWPSLLFLNGIDGIAHENRMLMFARQLQNKGIEHIALGNLSTAAIKKLDFS